MANERPQAKGSSQDGVQGVELPGMQKKKAEPSQSENGIWVYDAKTVLVGLRNLREHRRPAVDQHGEIIEGKFEYCTRPCCKSSAAKVRGEFIESLPVKDSDVPSPGTDEEGDATPPYDPWV